MTAYETSEQAAVEEEITWGETANEWMRTDGAWWASSFIFHMVLACALMLLGTAVQPVRQDPDGITGGIVDHEPDPAPPDVMIPPLTPPVPPDPPPGLIPDSVLPPLDQIVTGGDFPNSNDGSSVSAGGAMGVGSEPGSIGGLGLSVMGIGPGAMVAYNPGVFGGDPNKSGFGPGHGTDPFNRVARKAKARQGGVITGPSEQAVAAALHWLYRHQRSDGSWTLDGFKTRCTDASCSGVGSTKADSGATALALLPFLAAGQSHQIKGPYRDTIYRGLYWLMQHQRPDGNLAQGSSMYAHGLATITLCEVFGLSHDQTVGRAAQAAVRYIENAQHPADGGWRYSPGQEGDTSVTGWQIMALKSAQMALLSVNPKTLERAKAFLKACSQGAYGGRFAYQPGGSTGPAMTAVGLLCCQYTGVKRDAPMMAEGISVLMGQTADRGPRNFYYWYYAAQVMNNLQGPDWLTWNRKVRRILVDTQDREGCATGSWDPEKPSKDPWGAAGGRLMMTSLATLTLEVPYRYLPLYQLEGKPADADGGR